MLEIIGMVILWLVDFFFGQEDDEGNREGGLISTLWSATKDTGSAIVDWLSDDEVSGMTKIATVLGTGYLLAPDTTSRVVEDATDSAAYVLTTTGEATGSAISSVFDSIPPWAWIAGAIGLFIILDD